MRAAIYLKVSTKGQGQDTENQRLQLRQLCQVQGWDITHEHEDHESGGRGDRPQFRCMLIDAGARRSDLLLFWALDHLTREGAPATIRYLQLLESHGVCWRSFTEPWIDSSRPSRDVVINVLASLARQERLRIQETVAAGLQRARLTGTKSRKPTGRPRVAFGRDQIVPAPRPAPCSARDFVSTDPRARGGRAPNAPTPRRGQEWAMHRQNPDRELHSGGQQLGGRRVSLG